MTLRDLGMTDPVGRALESAIGITQLCSHAEPLPQLVRSGSDRGRWVQIASSRLLITASRSLTFTRPTAPVLGDVGRQATRGTLWLCSEACPKAHDDGPRLVDD